MFYHNITKDDMNNGDGLRVVLWVSGCTHNCPECHNPQTHSYNSGVLFDHNALTELKTELSKDYVSGITISGGDPLAPRNRVMTAYLTYWVKNNFPSKTIWIYTGYKYEQLVSEQSMSEGSLAVNVVLENIDVLVDGKYLRNLRDVNLKWRGSSNQRVIDVQKSLQKGEVVLWCD